MTPSLSFALTENYPGFSFGSFRLQTDGTLLRGAIPIHLPPKELAALRLLLDNAGLVITAAQLRSALWGDTHVTADSVPRCISSLRARLAGDDCIQTVYKRGYRITQTVRRIPPPSTAPLPRLAIVPFACGVNVPEHLGPAIAEETTARLTSAQPAPVSMLARDSVFTLARYGLSAHQIGQTLSADFVLAGVLHAFASHFRLRVEMIRVRDGTQIWIEDMLVDRNAAARLESELVDRLAFRIGFGLSLSASAEPNPSDPQAYDHFLLGRHEGRTLEPHRVRNGMEHLLRAVEIDPALLSAQFDLVQACVTQALYGFMSPSAAADQIRRVARSIPDLAGSAPRLLPALGWLRFHCDHDLPAALRLFDLSAHLPHDPSTTRMRVHFALSRHRFDDACNLLLEALHLDPYAPWLNACLAWAFHLAGRSQESLAQAEKCLRLFPDHHTTCVYGAIILGFSGDPARSSALALLLTQRSPSFDIAAAIHAYSLVREGRRAQALDILERLHWLSHERYVLTSFTAAACAALGDPESAIAQLRAAENARCPWFFQTLADPRLASLQAHPEFVRMRALLDRLEADAASASEALLDPAPTPALFSW